MDFDQIVAKYPGERYQAHLGLLSYYKWFIDTCLAYENYGAIPKWACDAKMTLY